MDPFWGLQMAYRWWEQVLWDVLAFSVRVNVCQSIHPKMAAILGPKDGTTDHGPRISMGSILGPPKWTLEVARLITVPGSTAGWDSWHPTVQTYTPDTVHIQIYYGTLQLMTVYRAECDGSKG